MDQGRRDFLRWTGLGAAGLAIPLPWWAKLFETKGRSMIAVPSNYGQIVPVGLTSREDLLDVITIVDPTETPLFRMFRESKMQAVRHEWITEELEGIVPGNNVARFLPRQRRCA